MDNWRGIEMKNRAVYNTCMKWFSMDIDAGRYSPPPHPNRQIPNTIDYKRKFFKRFAIGSYVEINGNIYEVVENHLHNLTNDTYLPIAQAIKIKNIKKIH